MAGSQGTKFPLISRPPVNTPEIVTGAVPKFARFTVDGELTVFTGTTPKLCSITSGFTASTPVPESSNACGLSGSFGTLKERGAVIGSGHTKGDEAGAPKPNGGHAASGENATVIEQLDPAARAVPHALTSAVNSLPGTVPKFPRSIAAADWFVNVTVCDAVPSPTNTGLKTNGFTEKATVCLQLVAVPMSTQTLPESRVSTVPVLFKKQVGA